MFFNRHALQVQMVRNPRRGNTTENNTTDKETRPVIDLEKINEIAKEQVTHVAIVGFGLYAAKKVLDTACDVAVVLASK